MEKQTIYIPTDPSRRGRSSQGSGDRRSAPSRDNRRPISYDLKSNAGQETAPSGRQYERSSTSAGSYGRSTASAGSYTRPGISSSGYARSSGGTDAHRASTASRTAGTGGTYHTGSTTSRSAGSTRARSAGAGGTYHTGSSASRSADAERRRRLAIRKRRRRKQRIRKAVAFTVLTVALVLGLFLAVKLITSAAGSIHLGPEPEMVEVREFIGLQDCDGQGVTVTEYGAYGAWLQLTGMFTPPPGKTVTSVSLELHDAYETKMVPASELTPTPSAEPETEEKKSFFGFGKKEDEEEEEEETETEFVPESHEAAFAYPMLHVNDESGIVVFRTSEYINDGVSLDSMAEGNYTMLLRADYADGTNERFTFADSSGMSSIDYYTITRNGSNDNVKIAFGADETTGQSYLLYDKEKAVLPADVYDFAIDAGHGGMDTGAYNGTYTESELTLAYAKGVYDKLTAMGYKVFLTRDGSEPADANMAYSMYDPDGRVNRAVGSHAKVCISIHFNSNQEKTAGGVEVYCSSRDNTELATLLADQIVNTAGTTYSGQRSYQVKNGVYVKVYTDAQVKESAQKAANNGFEPYDITTDTDYLFMIRELGGVWTNAYIDGRNPYFGENLYRDTNMGVEAYLIEEAYMSVDNDINNAVANADLYEKGMADALQIWSQTVLLTGDDTGGIPEPAGEMVTVPEGDAGLLEDNPEGGE